jgi:hypothetical protein
MDRLQASWTGLDGYEQLLPLGSDARARVVDASSEMLPECAAANVLSSDVNDLWLSGPGLPQHLTILLGAPREPIAQIGLHCWHLYKTNPRRVRVLSSADGRVFERRASLECALTDGLQLFELEPPIPAEDRYVRVLIRATHGGERTYLNRIHLRSAEARLSLPPPSPHASDGGESSEPDGDELAAAREMAERTTDEVLADLFGDLPLPSGSRAPLVFTPPRAARAEPVPGRSPMTPSSREASARSWSPRPSTAAACPNTPPPGTEPCTSTLFHTAASAAPGLPGGITSGACVPPGGITSGAPGPPAGISRSIHTSACVTSASVSSIE